MLFNHFTLLKKSDILKNVNFTILKNRLITLSKSSKYLQKNRT